MLLCRAPGAALSAMGTRSISGTAKAWRCAVRMARCPAKRCALRIVAAKIAAARRMPKSRAVSLRLEVPAPLGASRISPAMFPFPTRLSPPRSFPALRSRARYRAGTFLAMEVLPDFSQCGSSARGKLAAPLDRLLRLGVPSCAEARRSPLVWGASVLRKIVASGRCPQHSRHRGFRGMLLCREQVAALSAMGARSVSGPAKVWHCAARTARCPAKRNALRIIIAKIAAARKMPKSRAVSMQLGMPAPLGASRISSVMFLFLTRLSPPHSFLVLRQGQNTAPELLWLWRFCPIFRGVDRWHAASRRLLRIACLGFAFRHAPKPATRRAFGEPAFRVKSQLADDALGAKCAEGLGECGFPAQAPCRLPSFLLPRRFLLRRWTC